MHAVASSAPLPLPPAPAGAEKKKKKTAKKPRPRNVLTREAGRRLVHYGFEIPPALRTAVDFWKAVYSKYGRAHEVFHDTEYLDIIYSVLDFSDLYGAPRLNGDTIRALRRERVRAEKERIRDVLLTLDEIRLNPRPLSPEEKTIADFFRDDPNPNKYKEAAEDGRIRSQTGIRDNFIEGIRNSGAYLEEIEDVFASYGLPTELTRLIFVESMFHFTARSKVGASGLWQFMPATARLYLTIDEIADERNDPILASHAAARLLKSNYEALGTWPLAINAYNSGQATMRRAVIAMGGSDIASIIRGYREGVYGFASRNFFPSFLAALEVANHYPDYFGKVKPRTKTPYEYYYLQSPQFFGELSRAAPVSWQILAALNPHLQEAVLDDQVRIPAGYALRVPSGAGETFARVEEAAALSANADSGSVP
jgi:membrane-bound lytic murein transglycosylase D